MACFLKSAERRALFKRAWFSHVFPMVYQFCPLHATEQGGIGGKQRTVNAFRSRNHPAFQERSTDLMGYIPHYFWEDMLSYYTVCSTACIYFYGV